MRFLLLVILSISAYGQINTFQSGEKISSSKINDNFTEAMSAEYFWGGDIDRATSTTVVYMRNVNRNSITSKFGTFVNNSTQGLRFTATRKCKVAMSFSANRVGAGL